MVDVTLPMMIVAKTLHPRLEIPQLEIPRHASVLTRVHISSLPRYPGMLLDRSVLNLRCVVTVSLIGLGLEGSG